mmetsp:Transcript_85630/g.229111  ORF Transcript_85630/g.229111 Transcript_85630/m.229111 type:complete len:164 (-) Transcript_85630:109-600(-)
MELSTVLAIVVVLLTMKPRRWVVLVFGTAVATIGIGFWFCLRKIQHTIRGSNVPWLEGVLDKIEARAKCVENSINTCLDESGGGVDTGSAAGDAGTNPAANGAKLERSKTLSEKIFGPPPSITMRPPPENMPRKRDFFKKFGKGRSSSAVGSSIVSDGASVSK